ncbi:hypothetical protein WJ970_08130 [Achromobacter xylosoxidans]
MSPRKAQHPRPEIQDGEFTEKPENQLTMPTGFPGGADASRYNIIPALVGVAGESWHFNR